MQRNSIRFPKLSRQAALVVVTLVMAVAAAFVPASKAAAVPEITGNVVEHYQWCANRSPIPWWAGRSGYINAFGSRNGVTCRWWVMYDDKFYPITTDSWYTWDTVCRSLGWRGGYWTGIARCYR